MSTSTNRQQVAKLATLDTGAKVWIDVCNVDSFCLAVVAMHRDGDAIDLDPFGDEAMNVERLILDAADAAQVDADVVREYVAGWLWGIDNADECVRCGERDYTPVCPSCVLDAGCAIGQR